MNNTNRAANRLLILVVGIALAALGTAAILVVSAPGVRSGWKASAPQVRDGLAGWIATGRPAGSTFDWWWLAILAVLVVVIILLLVFVFRQGHGHTGRLLTEAPTEHGRTVIESRVAEHAIQQALDDHPELVSSHVSTYLVRGTPVLKVSATARRGVSPKEIVDTVERALNSLEHLLGQAVPASIQVGGGFRSRVTKTTRLQ